MKGFLRKPSKYDRLLSKLTVLESEIKLLRHRLVEVDENCGTDGLCTTTAKWYPIPEGPTEVTLFLTGREWSILEGTPEWRQFLELAGHLKKEGRLPPRTSP